MAAQTIEDLRELPPVPPAPDTAAAPQPRRFSVQEYHRMGEAGILRPDERVELVEGQVLVMSPIGGPHANAVRRADKLFTLRLVDRAEVSVQNPIHLDDGSEPQPDIALLRPRPGGYPTDHPTPADVFLVIEVADTTLGYDRREKVPLYARLHIPETWIEDLNGKALEVYRRPGPNGYADVRRLGRGERIAPLLLPDLEVSVDELLG